MTCIAALMDATHIYIGGDRMLSNGHVGSNLAHSKVFQLGKMLIGTMGSLRASQILRHHLELTKDTRKYPIDYMVQDLIPNIRACLEYHKFSSKDDKGKCCWFIVCYRSSIFVIQEDWSVCETLAQYEAIGSGGITAEGALFVLTQVENNLSTSEKLAWAISAAGNHIVSCNSDVDILKIKRKP